MDQLMTNNTQQTPLFLFIRLLTGSIIGIRVRDGLKVRSVHYNPRLAHLKYHEEAVIENGKLDNCEYIGVRRVSGEIIYSNVNQLEYYIDDTWITWSQIVDMAKKELNNVNP
jgi:hypothetical protein